MYTKMDEFAVLQKYLPLKDHLASYLLVKTKVNCQDDLDFRMASLDRTVRKFSHTGWTEMKDMVVGIKCTVIDEDFGFVWVRHTDRTGDKRVTLDKLDVITDEWYQFKYPLMDNYHTETRIMLSGNISSFTLAIMNTSLRVRHDAGINELPSGFRSFDTNCYGSYNKAIVYVDDNGKPLLDLTAEEKIGIGAGAIKSVLC
jgi:hypothetical protein